MICVSFECITCGGHLFYHVLSTVHSSIMYTIPVHSLIDSGACGHGAFSNTFELMRKHALLAVLFRHSHVTSAL